MILMFNYYFTIAYKLCVIELRMNEWVLVDANTFSDSCELNETRVKRGLHSTSKVAVIIAHNLGIVVYDLCIQFCLNNFEYLVKLEQSNPINSLIMNILGNKL